jgi:hypothetical protein
MLKRMLMILVLALQFAAVVQVGSGAAPHQSFYPCGN